jgi:hypothetical protein
VGQESGGLADLRWHLATAGGEVVLDDELRGRHGGGGGAIEKAVVGGASMERRRGADGGKEVASEAEHRGWRRRRWATPTWLESFVPVLCGEIMIFNPEFAGPSTAYKLIMTKIS